MRTENYKKEQKHAFQNRKERNVKTKLIDWFTYNMDNIGVSKAGLASYCNVSRQAVHKWVTTGIVSKENLITCSRYFQTVPPLDLISDKDTNVPVNPLTYAWSSSARRAVEIIKRLDDEKTNPIKMKLIAGMVEAVDTLSYVENNNLKDEQNYEWECNNKTRALLADLDKLLEDAGLEGITTVYHGNVLLGKAPLHRSINDSPYALEVREQYFVAFPTLNKSNADMSIKRLKDLLALDMGDEGNLLIAIELDDSDKSAQRFKRLVKNSCFFAAPPETTISLTEARIKKMIE